MKFLGPAELARLRNFRLAPRRRSAQGHLAGRRRAAAHGFSQEFAQHRPYVLGDELRRIDWKVYARRDRLFLKEYEEERGLPVFVAADVSGSMGFGGKYSLAGRLALASAYLVLARGDAAGLLAFDSGVRAFVPVGQAMTQLEAMDRELALCEPRGETDLGAALAQALGRIARRSLVVLVSDLLGDPERVLEALRGFLARRHRLIVAQVLDPVERDLDLEGPVLFESLEDAGRLRCEPALLRDSYKELFARRQRFYSAAFAGSGVAYREFYAGADWLPEIGRLLSTA